MNGFRLERESNEGVFRTPVKLVLRVFMGLY
jgi:hypothetical protein